MTAARAIAYRNILLIMLALSLAGFMLISKAGIDPFGKPIGTDFVSFWAASRIALAGDPASAYDVAAHWAAQRSLFPGAHLSYTAFLYPPLYLLICLPLALLPYFWSLAAWLAVTFYAYWRTMRAFAGRLGTLTILAFPAVYVNIIHGQNGFLTTALFGSGAMALRRRPVLAGICFGCLAYKPHMAMLVPVGLVAARQWTAFLAAAVTAITLTAGSIVILGVDTARGFLAGIPLATQTLEQGLVGDAKMQSAFAAARLLGANLTSAYVLQAGVALAAAIAVGWHARQRPADGAMAALMASTALLATPFVLAYDLVLLALPLAWLLQEAQRTGFRPWEKTVLILGFILPLVSTPLAAKLHVPLAPLVIALVLAAVARRVGAAEAASPEHGPG